MSITTSRISDPILKKIEKTVKDPKERQFLIDLLERELSYIDKDKPELMTTKDYNKELERRKRTKKKDETNERTN